jgi:hypothetical protein
MTDSAYHLERLRAEIELKRTTLFELRGVLFNLQTELEGFAAEYERRVGRIEADLEAVRREIRASQQTTRPHEESVWGPGIFSFDEYLESRRKPSNEPIKPIKPIQAAVDEDEVRTLYRKLARKYHPDTTTDPEEKARLSVVMARINAAYSAKDAETLRALEDQPMGQVLGAIPQRSALDSGRSTYQELLDLSHKLDDEIAWTREEHKNLMSAPLMTLKIECSLARGKGRDVLREMAARVEEELATARATLEALRR